MEPEDKEGLPPALQQSMTRYKAPPGLQRRVRFMLEQPEPLARPSRRAHWWRSLHRQWMAMGTSFALGVLLSASVIGLQFRENGEDVFEQQLVDNHVRSLMANHLSDVASSDQHTVKPWFSGKLDYTPVVVDLAKDGFPLIGGRLDYLHGQATAALVYQRNQHTINVFVRPEPPGSSNDSVRVARQHGFNIVRWTTAGMECIAISDASREELQALAAGIRAAAGG